MLLGTIRAASSATALRCKGCAGLEVSTSEETAARTASNAAQAKPNGPSSEEGDPRCCTSMQPTAKFTRMVRGIGAAEISVRAVVAALLVAVGGKVIFSCPLTTLAKSARCIS